MQQTGQHGKHPAVTSNPADAAHVLQSQLLADGAGAGRLPVLPALCRGGAAHDEPCAAGSDAAIPVSARECLDNITQDRTVCFNAAT